MTMSEDGTQCAVTSSSTQFRVHHLTHWQHGRVSEWPQIMQLSAIEKAKKNKVQ